MQEKPGWKTSEFWLKIGAFMLSALFASGVLTGHDLALQIAGIAATILGALGYDVSRTLVKANTTKAKALVEASKKDPT